MSTLAPPTPPLLVREDEPAVHITLNRPDKRNALSLELMQELTDTLRRVSAGPRRAGHRPRGRRSGVLAPATTSAR